MCVPPNGNLRVGNVAWRSSNDCGLCLPVMHLVVAEDYLIFALAAMDILLWIGSFLLGHVAVSAAECLACDQICILIHGLCLQPRWPLFLWMQHLSIWERLVWWGKIRWDGLFQHCASWGHPWHWQLKIWLASHALQIHHYNPVISFFAERLNDCISHRCRQTRCLSDCPVASNCMPWDTH